MAKAMIFARLDKTKRPFKPYLTVRVDDVDEEDFQIVDEWLKTAVVGGYERIHPDRGELGMVSIDFDEIADAKNFIEFLAGNIGVQYNIDSLFANKVMKIANYEAQR